jgi:hypothetical protein
MRIPFPCLVGCMLLVFSVGMALGQDTNFATGPQYLMQGSSLFARPISTPSMSLAGPPLEVGASDATQNLIAGADNQTVVPQPHSKVDLSPVFYTEVFASELKPSFSLAEPFPGLQLPSLIPSLQPSSSISPSTPSEASSNPLPPGILDIGVWQITNAQELGERGYGITVGEAAAYGKARTRHATRVYTNADVNRLHGGS